MRKEVQRHGGQLTPPPRNYKPLLITVSEEFSKFAGQTHSATATCERKPTNRMLEMRSEGDDGGVDYSHTPETSIIYHQAGLNIEPTRKEKKTTPKKYVEKGSLKRTGYSWRELEKKAQDRRLWKTVVNDLCPRRGEW